MRAVVAWCALTGAAAWSANGHMLTAYIAQQRLTPAAAQAADELVAVLAKEYPTSPKFVEASCWADDIRANGAGTEGPLHFIDIPVVRPPINFNVPELVTVSTNPWEIDQALTTVTSTKAAQLDRARQLRFLIHMIGDIHQPLHAAELYSDEFPSGDLGGNRYTIAGVTQKNLHSYWDSGANTWATGLKRPLDVQGEAWLSNLTGYITQAYPESTMGGLIAETDPFAWAAESNAWAANFTYTAPEAPTPIPQFYEQQALQICWRQIALGGYRLAATLNGALGQGAESLVRVAAALRGAARRAREQRYEEAAGY